MTDKSDIVVGLISMPWMSVSLPSIQLASLESALAEEGIASEIHEFFLDYAATIGPNLYNILSDAGGFVEEWIFAQHYYGLETGEDLSEFRVHRPRFGLASRELEDQALDALKPVTAAFLSRLATEVDWGSYDVIGFTLTISQTAASMALARLIKLQYPEIPIVFGGSSCAGPMGQALIRICPYVDVVVRVEGEPVFPELVRRLRSGAKIDDLSGLSWRAYDTAVRSTPAGYLFKRSGKHRHLNYDAYFKRLNQLGLADRMNVWLPFESSRGCWYGEKNQCTFCGLHEIMKYRHWTCEEVLDELEDWSKRYGIRQFFAVDLIMPMSFYDNLLPEIERRGHKWSLFYEIKANVKRWQVEVLAAGGVKWIQPGIESLDTDILKLMHKGVAAIQNIQLLKWCQELGIRVTWNIITGIPGEDPNTYLEMAQKMRLLYHLFPPSGASLFELHRFSPYFDHADQFGLKRLGAHPLYRYIFPIAECDIDELAYHYGYKLDRPESPEVYTRPVAERIREWHAAWRRRAKLTIEVAPQGSATIVDTRWSEQPARHWLNQSQAVLYLHLDAAVPESSLWSNFAAEHPQAATVIEEQGGVDQLLAEWEQHGLIVRGDSRVLAIAVNYAHGDHRSKRPYEELPAPVPYLSQAC